MKVPDVVDVGSEFDRTDRKQVESKLLGDAVSDARSKENVMAGASGQKIKTLRALSSDDLRNIEAHFGWSGPGKVNFFGARSKIAGAVPVAIFVPDSIKFSSSVSVRYALEEIK